MAAADDGQGGSDLADGAAGTPRHRGARDLFRRILEGPPTRPVPDESPRGRRRAIERLNERERRLSLLAALAAAVFAVVIYLTETHTKNFHLAKGQLQPQTTLALGLGAAVLLGVAAYFGRRAPVAFVALFGFFIFSNGAGVLLGLPFLALGGWLFYRSFKS
ncbi:MAG TPA: hypothetical protein VKW77_05025, partial [Acidimicrobiales bacterium]|nr:hypothetical protein [Acidimicrobiales bacterium]